eukprot:13936176-Alexandrium_andersonii.AAC.1
MCIRDRLSAPPHVCQCIPIGRPQDAGRAVDPGPYGNALCPRARGQRLFSQSPLRQLVSGSVGIRRRTR